MDRKLLEREYDDWYRRKPRKWTSHERNCFMIEHITQYPPPKILLDVGCGNGHTLEAVQGVYPDCQLYGMDISRRALRLTQEKVKDVHTVHAFVDTTSLDIKFDWVLCMGVAEHFEDLMPSLERLKSLTGGHCYMEIPHCLNYSPGPEEYRRLSCGSKQWEWHLTRDTWEQHLYAAGFEIVEAITGENRAWEFVWVLK
jgi:malonyl-CoA O-methyltransferase